MNIHRKSNKSNKYQRVVITNNPLVLVFVCVLVASGVYIGFVVKNQSLESNNNKLRQDLRELDKDYGRELANWNAVASEDALNELLEKNNYGFDMIKEDQHPNVIYMGGEGEVKRVKSKNSIARINRNKTVGVARSSY